MRIVDAIKIKDDAQLAGSGNFVLIAVGVISILKDL